MTSGIVIAPELGLPSRYAKLIFGAKSLHTNIIWTVNKVFVKKILSCQNCKNQSFKMNIHIEKLQTA